MTRNPDESAAREPPPARTGTLRPARFVIPANVVVAGLSSVLSFVGLVEVTDASAYLGAFSS